MSGKTVQFLYNKSNTYGLLKDIAVLKRIFREVGVTNFTELDPHEPPRAADIMVHLEVPVYGNIAWAATNIFLVNPEYYVPAAYDAYLPAFDLVVVRDSASAARLGAKALPFPSTEYPKSIKKAKMPVEGWLYVIGGSPRKMAAARAFLPLVRDGDQPIKIVCSRVEYVKELKELAAGRPITIEETYMEAEELQFLQKNTPGHIVLSEAEGFSHAAAEARAAGAVVFSTRCPALIEAADPEATVFAGDAAAADGTVDCSTIRRSEWEAAMAAIPDVASAAARELVRSALALQQWTDVLRAMTFSKVKRNLPPAMKAEECPKISVVTLTYNRRKFIDLAFHNLMWSDYPLDKIEWIVVDDSDNEHAISDKLMDFCAKVPALHLEYVPLAARTGIAEKRNIGCARASNDIIVFMDDDDHYPTTSFRRRVSWLLSGEKAAVGCSMIAMYDLVRGASAVNVPPWNIPLAQRLSEATLAFRKSFWEARPFTENIAEAEAWIAGRESQFLEIPPQHIIVALSHNNNMSSRRVPADAKQSCFWGFSPEMLKFLHGLAGMQVEFNDLKEPSPKAKKRQ
jgi:hypothetical protein